MVQPGLDRRGFLGAAAGAAAFTIVPRHVLGGPGFRPPSEKLALAGIGVGGMGGVNLRALETEAIVALCDVDRGYAAKTVQRYPQARFYADYRRLLAEEKELDGVVVATPDHTHAVIAMAALKAGKHVYCQKPLTHDIREARVLARAAAEAGLCTQMGIQGHSGEGIRLLCEWIWSGAIGEVREVDAWCGLSYYPFGHEWWSSRWDRRPAETPPVPEGLEWDLWLGPAAARPYHPAYHPSVWRCWWEFGVGMMGDRGTHTLDPVVTALRLGPPETIEASHLGGNEDTHPLAAIVVFRFPGREGRPPVKLTWYEGIMPPRPDDLEPGRLPGDAEGGAVFKGSEGTLICGIYGESPRLVPEKRMKEFKRPPKLLPRVAGGHEQDWVRACRGGWRAGADFAYAGPLTETCLLGNVAKRVGGVLAWDAANLKFPGRPEAEIHLAAPYRDGWVI